MANTTAIVMNSKTVYIMPGKQSKSKSLIISVLDCGNASMFDSNISSREYYGLPIAAQNWNIMEVANQDFVRSCPNAALQLNQDEMLIFGGETSKTFVFNTKNFD